MPVTTKAQLSAEGVDSGNCVKVRMCEFLSKIENSAKSRDNLKGHLFLPAEPRFASEVEEKAARQSGLLHFVPRFVPNSSRLTFS